MSTYDVVIIEGTDCEHGTLRETTPVGFVNPLEISYRGCGGWSRYGLGVSAAGFPNRSEAVLLSICLFCQCKLGHYLLDRSLALRLKTQTLGYLAGRGRLSHSTRERERIRISLALFFKKRFPSPRGIMRVTVH